MLSQKVVAILEPYVGPTVADTCVRATALSAGKSFDTLCEEDMPQLEASVRRYLSPVAGSATVDSIIESMRGL